MPCTSITSTSPVSLKFAYSFLPSDDSSASFANASPIGEVAATICGLGPNGSLTSPTFEPTS